MNYNLQCSKRTGLRECLSDALQKHNIYLRKYTFHELLQDVSTFLSEFFGYINQGMKVKLCLGSGWHAYFIRHLRFSCTRFMHSMQEPRVSDLGIQMLYIVKDVKDKIQSSAVSIVLVWMDIENLRAFLTCSIPRT